MAANGSELIAQLMRNGAYLSQASATIPSQFRVPNEDQRPLFIQVDFGLDENLQPKLVEMQGFPSLYAYQHFLTGVYREVYGLDSKLQTLFPPLTESSYQELIRSAILGAHSPENVILLEIEPEKQKTRCDFILTEQLCSIRTVCLTQIKKQGSKLYYSHHGKLIPIHRIYNRVIFDELTRKGLTPPFDFRDELQVEWAGHPNWYFKISKFSLPFLKHACVPQTWFLHDLKDLPADLDNYVLKPLYSFAGTGVRVGPTREDIAAVADPAQAILQERVHFRPVIKTPFGMTSVEIRIMYVWHRELQPVTALVRMGRGKMMGVDFNRDLQWVGASAAFAL